MRGQRWGWGWTGWEGAGERSGGQTGPGNGSVGVRGGVRSEAVMPTLTKAAVQSLSAPQVSQGIHLKSPGTSHTGTDEAETHEDFLQN